MFFWNVKQQIKRNQTFNSTMLTMRNLELCSIFPHVSPIFPGIWVLTVILTLMTVPRSPVLMADLVLTSSENLSVPVHRGLPGTSVTLTRMTATMGLASMEGCVQIASTDSIAGVLMVLLDRDVRVMSMSVYPTPVTPMGVLAVSS